MRLLNLDVEEHPKSFAELGFLPTHERMMQRARMTSGGAVCIAGTVGSGKSTTLATWIRKIPSHRKIISLEDPVEYLLRSDEHTSELQSLMRLSSAVFCLQKK